MYPLFSYWISFTLYTYYIISIIVIVVVVIIATLILSYVVHPFTVQPTTIQYNVWTRYVLYYHHHWVFIIQCLHIKAYHVFVCNASIILLYMSMYLLNTYTICGIQCTVYIWRGEYLYVCFIHIPWRHTLYNILPILPMLTIL